MYSDSTADHIQDIKRRAKICATAWTIIYALLFPILSYFSLFSAMVFDNPHISTLAGLSTIFAISLIPLSLPLSMELMWSSFICEEYKKTLFSWSLPWLTIVFFMVLDYLIRFFLI